MPDVTVRAGVPFPEETDVNDVPADMEALAVRVAGQLGAPAYTTLQRDALEGADLYDGRTIFNTDVSALQIRRGASWVDAATSVSQETVIVYAIALGG